MQSCCAVWEFGEATEKTGLEVDLNAKYQLKLDTFATNILLDVHDRVCARYIIVCGAKAVSRHYPKHFQPGNKIKLWDLNKKKPTGEYMKCQTGRLSSYSSGN